MSRGILQLQANKDIQRPMLFAFLRTERIFNFFFFLPLHGILANGFFALGPISNLSRVDFGSSPSDPKTTRACAAPPAHPRSPQAAGEANFTPNAAFLGCFPPFFQLQTASRRERGSPGASPGPALVKLVPVSLSAAPRALSRGSAAFIPFFIPFFIPAAAPLGRAASSRPLFLL